MDYLTETSDVTPPEVITSFNDGDLLCWGSGDFGQHGHGTSMDVTFSEGCIPDFSASCGDMKHARLVSCGSSHTVIVTGKSLLLFVTFGSKVTGKCFISHYSGVKGHVTIHQYSFVANMQQLLLVCSLLQ